MMMVARAMAMATVTKRAMATATMRVMAPNRNIAGTGNGKVMAATMAIGTHYLLRHRPAVALTPQLHKKRVASKQQRQQLMGTVTAQRTYKGHGRSHNAWRERDDGGDGPWFVCEFLGEWRDDKK
jgi:hypothetical protein